MSKPYQFALEKFFPKKIFRAITDARVNRPEVVVETALARRRRPRLTHDGRLIIIATDHPARGVTASGGNPILMGNRQEFLGRVLRVVTSTEFDGVMGPPDILDDLFIVDYLVQEGGGPSFLDGKVMVGCMQRGGMADVAGEIDDRFTNYTAEEMAAMRLDGGKMMFRIVRDDPATLNTISYCAQAVNDLNQYGLVPFVEPMPMKVQDGKYTNNYTVEELVRAVSVAAALGAASRNTWLKVPVIEDYEKVTMATTLPILMLGGASRHDPVPTIQEFYRGLQGGENVRGAMVGRNVLFPGPEDPRAVAVTINALVHEGLTAEQAIERMHQRRDQDMDFLTRYIR
ncbi:MAG: Cgl0159 family (beta/alpha)8-fold protein [Anaerolineae bacterium]